MNNASKITLFVIGLIVVGGVVFLGLNLNKTNESNNNTSTTITPSVKVTEAFAISETPTKSPEASKLPVVTTTVTVTTAASESAPPDGWKAIDNTSQKYIAYRPNGWYFKLFEPNMETLGIDVNAIPSDSEYAGLMTMTRLTASNNFESYKTNLEAGYTTDTKTISGKSWTIIKGKTPANELFGAQFIKYAQVTVNGKEFMAAIRSSAANFGGQEANFDKFVGAISFY